MASGLLFAAIVLGWAAYLIPHALRRYDQASRSRSIDRFSSTMRVLGRKPATSSVVVAPEIVRERREAQRLTARAAAKRRRRILVVLLFATIATVVVSALAYAPWWTVAIPSLMTVLFLWGCSRRVRGESDAYWAMATAVEPVSRPASEPPVEPDDEPTVVIDRREIAQIAVAVETAEGQMLWDPVPVTLPTYVSKPKAARTIRTINLGQPGTWTSGNTEEASALVERKAATDGADADPRRAVGS